MGKGQYLSQRRLRLFIKMIVALILAAAIIFTIYEVIQDKKTVSIGEKAPGFALKSLDGQTVKLSDFEGQGVLLNFWASWCGPCKAEMPFINEAERDHIKGVKILAVNIRETRGVARAFLEKHHFDFMTVLDSKGKITDRFNVVKIPSSYLIDKNGKVVKKIVGPMTSRQGVIKNLKLIQP